MAKKNKQNRNMELDNQVESVDVLIEEPKVEFDAWYAARASAIPAIHKKEIIKADFKGRKVPMVSTMADFDKALEKYGVKLA